MPKRKYTEQDIPLDILEKFGMTQQMVEDLPQSERNKLMDGSFTTEMPISITHEDGSVIRTKAAIKIISKGNDEIDLLVAPMWKRNELQGFSEEEVNNLRAGKVLLISGPHKGDKYVQLDDVSNHVISEEAELIQHNIQVYQKLFDLDEDETSDIMKGDPITIGDIDDPFTIGVDLHSPEGIHHVDGDKIEWEKTRRGDILPHFNFGMFGCWVTDDNGTLDHYVVEEKYTKQMIDEMQRVAEQNMNNYNENDQESYSNEESDGYQHGFRR